MFHFPLKSLVYTHSIWVPTDDDIQQYLHVFFTSPDIWDASVLDHGISPALLEEIQPEVMILCQRTPHLMNLEVFTKDFYSTWMFSGIQALQTLGSTLFILIFTRAVLLRKIGSHSELILDGNPTKLSKKLTRLLPGLEVLSLNMIT